MVGKVATGDYCKIGVIHCQKYIRLKMKWVGLTLDKKSLWMAENPVVLADSLEEYFKLCKKE